MTDPDRRVLAGLAQFLVALAALIFLPAWTLAWWQAWLFLAVFAASVLAITAYLMKHDPALLARRLAAGPTAESERSQKVIQSPGGDGARSCR